MCSSFVRVPGLVATKVIRYYGCCCSINNSFGMLQVRNGQTAAIIQMNEVLNLASGRHASALVYLGRESVCCTLKSQGNITISVILAVILSTSTEESATIHWKNAARTRSVSWSAFHRCCVWSLLTNTSSLLENLVINDGGSAITRSRCANDALKPEIGVLLGMMTVTEL